MFVIGILLITSLGACKGTSGNKQEKNLIASVFKHNLYYNDIPEDLRNAANPADSSALVNGFVDQWIRKMLLLHEAEKRKPESLDIEKLVEDYKQSLLINNLEKQVIVEELDTVISNSEYESLYETIKENHIQEYAVIRLSYFKIPEKAQQIDKFYEWWKKDNKKRMHSYAEKYAETYLMEEDTWNKWEEVKKIIDDVVLKRYSFQTPKSVQKNIGEYEYFVTIHEFADKGQISPLGIIRDQLKNIILQKRKTNVMDDYLERIYLKELKNENIIIKENK